MRLSLGIWYAVDCDDYLYAIDLHLEPQRLDDEPLGVKDSFIMAILAIIPTNGRSRSTVFGYHPFS